MSERKRRQGSDLEVPTKRGGRQKARRKVNVLSSKSGNVARQLRRSLLDRHPRSMNLRANFDTTLQVEVSFNEPRSRLGQGADKSQPKLGELMQDRRRDLHREEDVVSKLHRARQGVEFGLDHGRRSLVQRQKYRSLRPVRAFGSFENLGRVSRGRRHSRRSRSDEAA